MIDGSHGGHAFSRMPRIYEIMDQRSDNPPIGAYFKSNIYDLQQLAQQQRSKRMCFEKQMGREKEDFRERNNHLFCDDYSYSLQPAFPVKKSPLVSQLRMNDNKLLANK